MSTNETAAKLREINTRRNQAVSELIVPSRAAANVLNDLKQISTAKAIEEVLYQIDLLEQELRDFIRQDPEACFEALFAEMERGR